MTSVVVVTGAASGIGDAVSRRLVADGHAVVAVDWNATDAHEDSDGPGRAVRLTGDVRDRETHEAAARIAAELGVLTGWVNCAGVSRPSPLLELTDSDLHDLFDVNFRGCLWGSRAAVESMRASGAGGSIVNVSSVHGRRAYPDYVLYEASKAAIEALTRSVAVTYAAEAIRCNAVAPGGVETPALRASLDSAADPAAALAELTEMIPAGRLAGAAEVADAVSFLLGPGSTYVTAQTLVVDGGMTSHVGFRESEAARRTS